MLVDIETTIGTSLAKIIQENKSTYTISYLSYKKNGLYEYEPPCEVEKECISGFYNPEDTEGTAGFRAVEGGYMLVDDDSDYEPSESGSESDDDVSLDDEESDSSSEV